MRRMRARMTSFHDVALSAIRPLIASLQWDAVRQERFKQPPKFSQARICFEFATDIPFIYARVPTRTHKQTRH